MPQPSVLFINRVYPPGRGASGRVLRDLARAFAKEGWDVSVLTTGPRSGREVDGPVRIHRIKGPMRPRKALSYFWIWLKFLFKALFMPRCDLVVTMTDPPMLIVVGRVFARMKRARHVHWCQDLYPDLLPEIGVRVPGFMMRFLKKLSRRSMKSCEKVVTIGRCMARQLTHTGVEPVRVSVIPNWTDAEILDPARASAPGRVRVRRRVNGARAANDLFRDMAPRFRVLYAGTIGRAWPMETVLDAAEMLSGHTEIEFVFVGDGPGHEALAAERARRGLDNIKLLPFQPAGRLRRLMESGDAHLVTIPDGAAGMLVPCKFYAALAVGRPCIYVGPENTEVGRVIADYHAGSVVAQGDPAALAEAVFRYRMDGEAWFAAQEGAGKAGSVFVPDQSIRAWIKGAREALGRVA